MVLPICKADVPVGQNTFHPFSFAVLSDLHLSENGWAAAAESQAMEMIAGRHDIAFVLVLGDIVWDKDPESLKPVLATAGVPVHLVYGNNDWKWVNDVLLRKSLRPARLHVHLRQLRLHPDVGLPPARAPGEPSRRTERAAVVLARKPQLQSSRASYATHTFVSMHVPAANAGGV